MKVTLILAFFGCLAFSEAYPRPLGALGEVDMQRVMRYVRSPKEAFTPVEKDLEGSETAYGGYYYPNYFYHHYPYYYVGK